MMNARAEAWGLEQSSFANPTGLPHPNQRMSMRDLAKLARHIWFEYPSYRYLFSIPEFTWSDITQANRNPLIGVMEGARGMKTGHTEEAGYGVVGLAERDGIARIAVVTGLDSEAGRREAAIDLMDEAFDSFDEAVFFRPGDLVGFADVFAGQEETVPLRIDQEVRFLLHKTTLRGAEAEIQYEGPLRAPIKEGQQVAILSLSMPDQPTRDYPVFTAGDVRGLGFFQKVGLGLQKLLTPPESDEA
jgi:D-alanyl-D-alanine carboxypeptidase (penicillin-binding protein 5/6)